MHTTVFDTPLIRTILYWISVAYLRIFGWRREGALPDIPRYVMIAAPHTTNWDMPITLFMAFAYRAKVYWMGKDTLFRRPFGGLMRWLGGIPIDRSRANNVVQQSVEAFQNTDRLVMVIPPEGTRKSVPYWKTGFYHIAHGAGVPIVLGFLDFKRKTGGIGPVVWPTGDIATDMRDIQTFYARITGKYPENMSPVDVRPVQPASQPPAAAT